MKKEIKRALVISAERKDAVAIINRLIGKYGGQTPITKVLEDFGRNVVVLR